MNKIWELYKKYKEQINYIVVGGMTTLVNFVIYAIDMYFGMDMMINLVVSWVVAVIFAYVTNRIIVFESKENNILHEFTKFVSSRIASLLIEMLLMKICVDFIGIKEYFAKVGVAIVVVIVNYVLNYGYFPKIMIMKKLHKGIVLEL